jgi:hypothetical protein
MVHYARQKADFSAPGLELSGFFQRLDGLWARRRRGSAPLGRANSSADHQPPSSAVPPPLTFAVHDLVFNHTKHKIFSSGVGGNHPERQFVGLELVVRLRCCRADTPKT